MDIELAQALAENELLKSLLYCTKRSCNNCGKVNCENFQRQRIDCCGNWVSYKDYIKKLQAQIEKMKYCSNCKHFNKEDDIECCWNCERQLVNSLDNLSREEIIKDEWEIKEK